MKLTCNGHSCFTIEAGGYSIVTDPYEDGCVPGLPVLRLTADAVITSHDHYDHHYEDAVTLTGRECPFKLTTIPTYHDETEGSQRGTNLIHIIEYDGVKIAHLGDLGHRLSQEQLNQLKGLDAILIPVGGFYTIDAKTASEIADEIGAPVVIPMHYRNGERGFKEISELQDFLALRDDVVYAGKSIEIVPGMKKQTAVVDFAG